MKPRKEGGLRSCPVRCYLSDEEYQRFSSFAQALNITTSDLIRRKIIYGSLLDVDPSKLLGVFVQIGKDLAQIRSLLSQLKIYPEERNGSLPAQEPQEYGIIIQDYQAAQKSLEQAIKMLIIRMDHKRKMP
ncbi:plasmid mobilization protein [Pedobacter kyonggii]|uniref:Uncharacterized protein n=1 Tax=Pedobacter kyonggii TaxID=1926871 RepID=A0A4V2JGU8_9SPHI|nr:hypothetical protein [Pedobacter kyonggii]TBO42227.1 hypothetical protein EYS08_11925 [Pedobacter kyonggii]